MLLAMTDFDYRRPAAGFAIVHDIVMEFMLNLASGRPLTHLPHGPTLYCSEIRNSAAGGEHVTPTHLAHASTRTPKEVGCARRSTQLHCDHESDTLPLMLARSSRGLSLHWLSAEAQSKLVASLNLPRVRGRVVDAVDHLRVMV